MRRWMVGVAVPLLAWSAAFCADDGPELLRPAGLVRAHLDYPAIVSVGFGVLAARLPASFECGSACLFRGVTVQGAVGPGAGELAVGYGSLVGQTGGGRGMIRKTFVGYGVRAAVQRTWGNSPVAPEGATFVGVEGAWTLAQSGLRLGIYRRTESSEHGSDWRIFGGLGWGF